MLNIIPLIIEYLEQECTLVEEMNETSLDIAKGMNNLIVTLSKIAPGLLMNL